MTSLNIVAAILKRPIVQILALGCALMRGSALVRAWAFIQENTGTQGLLNELELRGFVFTVQGANFRC